MPGQLGADVRQTILGDALPYEFQMLEGTYLALKHLAEKRVEQGAAIAEGSLETWATRNALIESFCIHARQLLEFFENKQGVRAKQLTVSGTYKAKEIGKVPDEVTKKLNTQIAHLTEKRTADDAKKLDGACREELLRQLCLERTWFLGQLSSPDRALFESKFQTRILVQKPSDPGPSSAGGAF